jgi:hypothetical protein
VAVLYDNNSALIVLKCFIKLCDLPDFWYLMLTSGDRMLEVILCMGWC